MHTPGACGGGLKFAPSNPVRLLQSPEAPCLRQPFSVDMTLHRFGIGEVQIRLLRGLVCLCFLRLISCGSWALFFVLIAWREGVQSVDFSDLSSASLTFRLLG